MNYSENPMSLENFWDELEVKCPKAVDLFKKWIDEYKADHEWTILFGELKFHEIFPEMQWGILLRFEFEILNQGKDWQGYVYGGKRRIEVMFENYENHLKKRADKKDNSKVVQMPNKNKRK